MEVYIRTNFSNTIGLGHIIRTTRLALEMKKKGIKCTFVLDKFYTKNLINFKKIFLYKNSKNFISEINDAKLFCKLTKKNKQKYVLIDDYRLGKKWQRYVSKYYKKIIIFDDLEDKEHFADVIINYNPKNISSLKYDFSRNKKDKCNFLINPKYNIISKQNITKNYNFLKSKFYITFYIGGGGNQNTFYKLLINLAKKINNNYNIKLLIIVGLLSKNKNLIYKLAKKYECIETISGYDNLYYIIKKTKIFVGTSGTAIFETAFLKTPSILFNISKNQETDIFSLEKIGHYFFLKSKDLLLTNKFIRLIFLIFKYYSRFQSFIKKPEIKIDNNGTKRLVNSIFFTQNNNKKKKNIKKILKHKFKHTYKICPVEDKDINHYLYCRNLEINKKNSSNYISISILDHYIWWFKTNRKSYVLLRNGIKILYFYEEKLTFISKNNYLLSGWFACVKNCTIKDISQALNWQRNKNKKVKWISLIKKTNHLSIKISKYIGWRNMDKKNKIINILARNFKINRNKFIFQER